MTISIGLNYVTPIFNCIYSSELLVLMHKEKLENLLKIKGLLFRKSERDIR